MGTVAEDLARILKQLERDHREVVRLTLHPADFADLQREAGGSAFSSAPYSATQVACRGHIWGVAVHVDPRNEKNIAYVVTKDDDARGVRRGAPFLINKPPEPVRRTAWSRVLEDDPLGVDPQGER